MAHPPPSALPGPAAPSAPGPWMKARGHLRDRQPHVDKPGVSALATRKGHGAPRGHAPHDTQDTGVCTRQPSQTQACAQVPMAGAQTAGPPRPRPPCAHAARRPPRMVHTGRPLSMAAPGATCPATSVARRPCDQLPWHAREAAVPSPCLPPRRGPVRGWGAHPAPGPGLPNVLLSLGHQGRLT